MLCRAPEPAGRHFCCLDCFDAFVRDQCEAQNAPELQRRQGHIYCPAAPECDCRQVATAAFLLPGRRAEFPFPPPPPPPDIQTMPWHSSCSTWLGLSSGAHSPCMLPPGMRTARSSSVARTSIVTTARRDNLVESKLDQKIRNDLQQQQGEHGLLLARRKRGRVQIPSSAGGDNDGGGNQQQQGGDDAELRAEVARHFNAIAEGILTMKCPRCQSAFDGEQLELPCVHSCCTKSGPPAAFLFPIPPPKRLQTLTAAARSTAAAAKPPFVHCAVRTAAKMRTSMSGDAVSTSAQGSPSTAVSTGRDSRGLLHCTVHTQRAEPLVQSLVTLRHWRLPIDSLLLLQSRSSTLGGGSTGPSG